MTTNTYKERKAAFVKMQIERYHDELVRFNYEYNELCSLSRRREVVKAEIDVREERLVELGELYKEIGPESGEAPEAEDERKE